MKTKAFEQWLKEQAQMVVRYRQIEKSDVLAEYNSLKKVVDSAEFQAKKKELTTTRYADTQEGKTMTDYKYLRKKSSVFLYRLLKKAAWKEKPEVKMGKKCVASFLLIVAVSFYLDLGAVLDTEGHNTQQALRISSSATADNIDCAVEL